jgi:hypothetical protein
VRPIVFAGRRRARIGWAGISIPQPRRCRAGEEAADLGEAGVATARGACATGETVRIVWAKPG